MKLIYDLTLDSIISFKYSLVLNCIKLDCLDNIDKYLF